MFQNSLTSSKTFIVILLLILIDALMRMPLLGLGAEGVEQVHELIIVGMISFAGKEAVTNFASKGQSSGTYKVK